MNNKKQHSFKKTKKIKLNKYFSKYYEQRYELVFFELKRKSNRASLNPRPQDYEDHALTS